MSTGYAAEPTQTEEVAKLRARVAELESRQAKTNNWITKAAQVCERAAKGDLEARLLHVDVDDDLGRMIHSINSMLDYTDAFVRESRAALSAAAEGKFFRKVLLRGMAGTFKHASQVINASSEDMQAKSQAIEQAELKRRDLADEFEATIAEISKSISVTASGVLDTSRELAETATSTAAEAEEALEASTRTSENVTQVASSTKDLTTSVARIEKEVLGSNDVVRRAVSEAQRANEIVVGLDESSTNIDTVVEAISSIAKQTNLLALNAAIEAARAGDAGLGFAVVASEVRKLAEKTREATEDVKTELSQVQVASGNAVAAINSCSSTIAEIDAVSETILNLVRQQSTAVDEISEHAGQAAYETNTVADGIGKTSQAAELTRTSTDSLLEAAAQLIARSATLSSSTEHLLGSIRAE